MDRMSMLETSSQQWKVRVSQCDATQFTVAHKINSSSTSSVPSLLNNTPQSKTNEPSDGPSSPTIDKKKKSPQAKVFKSKTGGNIPDLLGKSQSPKKDFRRSVSQPSDPDKEG